jgi:urease accessory protein
MKNRVAVSRGRVRAPQFATENLMSPAITTPDAGRLVRVLQLASSTLALDARGFAEGLEQAVHAGRVQDARSFKEWLLDGLFEGSARLEAAVLVRVYDAIRSGDRAWAERWDDWLTVARETEAPRARSLEMGRALMRMLLDFKPRVADARSWLTRPCNFVSAFAIAAADWAIPCATAVTAYLQCWVNELIAAGLRPVPLGQTAAQQLLRDMRRPIVEATGLAIGVARDDYRVGNPVSGAGQDGTQGRVQPTVSLAGNNNRVGARQR